MQTDAVIAHYLADYRHRSESFTSFQTAFNFLREEALRPGVLVDKITLGCGTVILSREDFARLARPQRPTSKQNWEAAPLEAGSSPTALSLIASHRHSH